MSKNCAENFYRNEKSRKIAGPKERKPDPFLLKLTSDFKLDT